MANVTRDLIILQYNINSIRPSETRALLANFLTTNHVDIAILSEIWLKPSEDINFNGYKFPKLTRSKGYGGVGFLIKNDLAFKLIKLPDVNPIEVIAVQILNTLEPIYLFSVYIPPLPINNSQLKEPLKKLLAFIDNLKAHTIFAGDVNAHHPSWNSANNICPRGELLVNLLDDSDLVIINDGSPTLIKPPNTIPSAIDLTLATPQIANKLDWEILDKELSGNHKMILFKIVDSINAIHYTQKIVNKSKAIKLINKIDVSEVGNASDLQESLNECINQSVYNLNVKKNKPKKWWTAEIDTLLKEKNDKLKNYFKNLTQQNFLDFRKARAKLKSIIRREKRKSFKNLIDDITPNLPPKVLWNTVRMLSGSFSKKDNLVLMNNEKLAQQFMDINFPPTETIKYTPKTRSTTSIHITTIDFLNILKTKKDSSAPGNDSISYYILKQLNSTIIEKIVKVLNQVVENRCIPEEWRTVKIVPIHKQGKPQMDPLAYRPISLIQVFLKSINIVVKREIESFIENNNIIPNCSFGFKKRSSAINCVNFLISKIQESKRNNFIPIVTFLDLSKAFDNVDIEILLETLTLTGIPSDLVDWVYFYLKERKATITLNNGKEISAITNKGLPQGCPLSPLLFNIYTSKLHDLADEDTIFFQFADDFAILVKAKNIPEATHKMNNILNKIQTTLSNLKLKLNPDKSTCVCFTNKFHDNLNIQIDNVKIKTEPYQKYLGMWMDHKLKFKKHITETVFKIRKKTNILKMLSKKNGGAHPQVMLQINKSLVRSHIDYGISIYGSACKTDLNRIQVAQNVGLRLSLRLLKSTPNHVVLAETGELPVDLRASILTLKETAKTLYFRNSPIVETLSSIAFSDQDLKHLTFLENNATLNNFLLVQICAMNSTFPNFDTNKLEVRINLESVIKNRTNRDVLKTIAIQTIHDKYSDFYKIYTDGTKCNTGTGFGFYDPQTLISVSHKLNPLFTIANAELIGILEAIKYANEKGKKKICILTDSKSGCQMILNCRKLENYIVNEIYIFLEKTDISKVVIQWIPSHTGILGNERADTAAKLSLNRQTVLPFGLTLGDVILACKNLILEDWNRKYKIISEDKGINHFKILSSVSDKPWFYQMPFNTIDVIRLSRVRSLHTATKERLHSWGLIASSLCDSCNIVEDLPHILFDCTKYNSIRNKYPVLINNTDIIEIAKTKSYNQYKQITNYLEEIKISV